MTLLFEISLPFQWRPRAYTTPHFWSVVWLVFAVRVLRMRFREYNADIVVARAMRLRDEKALERLGANVAWVRVGDLTHATVVDVDEDGTLSKEREKRCVITRIEMTPEGRRIIHSRDVELS